MKLMGRFNPLDFAVVVVLMISLAGFFMSKAHCAGVDKAITGRAKINIVIYFSGLKTKDADKLFKTGERASLTIRNQPVEPPMVITAVSHYPKRIPFLMPDGKSVKAFDDPATPLAHDFEVTISDEAEGTKDGYVVRGQKIKIGNTVELESFAFRVQGVVVAVNAAPM